MLPLTLSTTFEDTFFPELQNYMSGLDGERERIREERKEDLHAVAEYVAGKLRKEESVKMVFICTHNSRRSHFGQVWSTVAAAALDITGISTYSGGTAVTSFNRRAAAALERAGLRILRPAGSNPPYEVTYSGRRPAMICYSKIYDDAANPRSGFAALMTCNEANAACPIVPGAEARFALSYEDPKSTDGTPRETSRYDERCRQIATEMLYLFSEVKQLL